MDNLEIWNRLKQPPKWALKEIKGGRLAGKTDISPQWRYQAMTEVFGLGNWKYSIQRTWTEPAPDGQVFAFAEVMLYYRTDAEAKEWGNMAGIGGSMLIEKEAKGLHANDEAFKMAVTDALSVCMKMLGVAADIYAGLWDGSKYKEPAQEGAKAAFTQSEPKPKSSAPFVWNAAAIKQLQTDLGKLEDVKAWDKDNVLSYLNVLGGKETDRISLAVKNLDKEQSLKFLADIHTRIGELEEGK